MARLGVTYQDIASAANQLVGQGKQPTIEMIRQFLGTGSSTTIANHLRKWRQEQDGTLSLSRAENLPKEMITLMKGLWDSLCGQAQEKITAHETKCQQTIAELQQELQKYKTNNQRWQQLFNQWTKEKEQLKADKLSVEQAVEAIQKEKIALQAKIESQASQLQEKQDRIDELNRLHALAQANLEHYRESAREQRLIEQQQFEQQKQELQSEIKTLKGEFILLQEKRTSTQQQYQALQQAHAVLETMHAKTESRHERQCREMVDLEKVKTECQHASQHWRDQYQAQQKVSDAKIAELAVSQAEIKVLSKQLDARKQVLAELQDQNKLLGHEKWVLAQEKAQLEGQLKQMQKIIA